MYNFSCEFQIWLLKWTEYHSVAVRDVYSGICFIWLWHSFFCCLTHFSSLIYFEWFFFLVVCLVWSGISEIEEWFFYKIPQTFFSLLKVFFFFCIYSLSMNVSRMFDNSIKFYWCLIVRAVFVCKSP